MKGKHTVSDIVAMIVSLLLPRSVKYYAMLDWFDWVDSIAADTEEFKFILTTPGYTVEYKKKEEA